MAGKNCKCVVCGKEYHHCSSCGTNDDNWSLHYSESSYCSAECYRKSEEYVKDAPLLLRLWESLSEEQKGLFEEYMDTEDSDEFDEWRNKLHLAKQSVVEDRSEEVTNESLLETYESFDIFERTKVKEYPNPDLNEVLERRFYAISEERGIRLPISRDWRAYKEGKDADHVYNYSAPEHLSRVDLNNIYSVIDLIVKHNIQFGGDGDRGFQHAAMTKLIEEYTAEVVPVEKAYKDAVKRLEMAKQRKALLEQDFIEVLK